MDHRLSFTSIGSIDEDLFSGLPTLGQVNTTTSSPAASASAAPVSGWSDIEIPSNSLSFLDDLDFFSAVPPVPSAATPPTVAPAPAPISIPAASAGPSTALTLPVALHPRPSSANPSSDQDMDDASFVSHLSSDDGMTPTKVRSTASSAVTLPTTSPAPSMGSVETEEVDDFELFDELDAPSPRATVASTRRRATSIVYHTHPHHQRVTKRKRSPRGPSGAMAFSPVAPPTSRRATAAAAAAAADNSFPLVRMSASTANARGSAAEEVRCALCSCGYKNGDKWRNIRRIHLHWYRLMQSGALVAPSGAPLRLLSEWSTKDPYKAWAKAKEQRVSSHFKVFSANALARAFEPNSTDILVHKHCLHAFNFVVKARYDDLVAVSGYSAGPHPDEFGSTYSKRDLEKDLMFDPTSATPRYINPSRLFRGAGAGAAAAAPVTVTVAPAAPASPASPAPAVGLSSPGAGVRALPVGTRMHCVVGFPPARIATAVAPMHSALFTAPAAAGLVTAARVIPVRTASALAPPLKRIRKPSVALQMRA